MAREKHDYVDMYCGSCGRELATVKERKIVFLDVTVDGRLRTFVFCSDKCRRDQERSRS
jgi:hypothetical protein